MNLSENQSKILIMEKKWIKRAYPMGGVRPSPFSMRCLQRPACSVDIVFTNKRAAAAAADGALAFKSTRMHTTVAAMVNHLHLTPKNEYNCIAM